MNSPVLFLLVPIGFAAFFVFEGLVLGKLFQPALVYVGYVTIARPTAMQTIVVTGAAALGATTGQWLLYRTFTPTRPPPGSQYVSTSILERVPGVLRRRLGQRWVTIVERQIDRFGAYGIAVCSAVPWIRMVVPILAGLGAQPERRYTAAAAVGNLVYMLLLLTVAYSVLGLGQQVI